MDTFWWLVLIWFLIHLLCSAANKFFLSILLASVHPFTWLGGGYNSISAAKWRGVQPLIPYTRLSRANTMGECWTPLSWIPVMYDLYLLKAISYILFVSVKYINFKLISLVSVLPCTWLGGGYNLISAAQWKGVQPLKPFHPSCANASGECWSPFT